MDIFVSLLKHLIVEDLYAASAAELKYDIVTSDKGIVVKVYGFNQKLPVSTFYLPIIFLSISPLFYIYIF